MLSAQIRVHTTNVGAGYAGPKQRSVIVALSCGGQAKHCEAEERNIQLQFFTLILLSFIYFVVFLNVLFDRKNNSGLTHRFATTAIKKTSLSVN